MQESERRPVLLSCETLGFPDEVSALFLSSFVSCPADESAKSAWCVLEPSSRPFAMGGDLSSYGDSFEGWGEGDLEHHGNPPFHGKLTERSVGR